MTSMLEFIKTKEFEKDLKNLNKKHYDFSKLFLILELLKEQQPIPSKYKNHYLKGDLQGYQESHVEKDILLIYKIIDDKLLLSRLGTHSAIY